MEEKMIEAQHRDTTYETALEVHEGIMRSGQAAAISLMEMCRGLKKMRDARLYSALGFDSFDEYCENKAGIRARQAYSYIAVYERFGERKLSENAALGVTKLELISKLPYDEQNDVLTQAGLEGMSVSELKDMVESYRRQGEQTEMFPSEDSSPEEAESGENSEAEELRAELESVKKLLDEANRMGHEEAEKVRAKAKADIDELMASAEAEKKKAIDSAVREARVKAKEKAMKDAEKLAEERADGIIKEKESSLKSAVSAEMEKKYAEEIKGLKQAISEAEGISSSLREKLKSADGTFSALKIYFDSMKQNFERASDMISKMEDEDREKYRTAFVTLLGRMKEGAENL